MRILISIFSIAILSIVLNAQTNNPDYFEQQKTRALEVEFFSPLSGNLTIGYEKVINEKFSHESRLGIIGLGVNYVDQVGAFVKSGIKIQVNPTEESKGTTYEYLEGSYFKPEISYSIYNIKEYENYESHTEHCLAFQLVGGTQNVIAEFLVVDIYAGIGYGYSTENFGPSYAFSQFHFGNQFPLTLSGGFSVGILMK